MSLLVLPLLVLSGCSGDHRQSQLADYTQRLANTLEYELPPLTVVELVAFPGKRQLLVTEPTQSIDLLDFLALGDCELSQSLARHNSNLGKVSPASQQLLYQLEFLKLAPACIGLLENKGDAKLAELLRAAQQSKLKHLDAYIWQALLGGGEFRIFWRAPQDLGDYPQQVSGEVIAAMAYLQQQATAWLSQDYSVNSAKLEANLQKMRGGDGGQLFAALALQSRYLEQGNQMLRQKLHGTPLCYAKQPNAQSLIMRNVVNKYWVLPLQPWSSQINRRYYELLNIVRPFEALLAKGEPDAYQRWRLDRDRKLDHLVTQPKQHIQAIQPLLEQCGIAPGQDKPSSFEHTQRRT